MALARQQAARPSGVYDRPVEVPVVPVVLGGVGEVEPVYVAEVEGRGDPALLREGADGAPQLPPAARDEGPPGGHGGDVGEHRVVEVRLGERGLGERDRPVDAQLGVRQVHEGVGPLQLRGPVGVHQVGVGGAALEGLEGVAHAARDVDRAGGVEGRRVDAAVGGAAGAQVHPGAEDRSRGHGYELVPGLRVDAAGDAALGVEGDVVLDHAEIGDPQRHHLGALPVLLEPAAGVPVDGELHDLEPLDAGLLDGELLLELHLTAPSRARRRRRAATRIRNTLTRYASPARLAAPTGQVQTTSMREGQGPCVGAGTPMAPGRH